MHYSRHIGGMARSDGRTAPLVLGAGALTGHRSRPLASRYIRPSCAANQISIPEVASPASTSAGDLDGDGLASELFELSERSMVGPDMDRLVRVTDAGGVVVEDDVAPRNVEE